MPKHNTPALLLGAALLALPLQAMPQSDGPEERLVEKYDRFAGSEKNARELVEGLRNDSRIQLTKGGKTTTFTSPTKDMGWGNVDISLALAKASLAEQGIRNPTPEQIKAALVGGTVRTSSGKRVTLAGVLDLRASGMGWGQVAHELGFKLGEVMRPQKKDHGRDGKQDRGHDGKHADAKPERKHEVSRHEDKRAERPERAQLARMDRVERPEKLERPDKIERPQKLERPSRPERPERHGRH